MIDESQIEYLRNGENLTSNTLNRPLRQLVSATNTSFAPAAHTHPVSQVTGLGTAATKDVGTNPGEVMPVGAFGWGSTTDTPISMDANLSTTSGVYQGGGEEAINFAPFGNYGTLLVTRRGAQIEQLNTVGLLGMAIRSSMDEGVTWSEWIYMYTSKNQLEIGITPETARDALELTGEWVDLRPHLKPGYYFDPEREGKNAPPRIRKLSCGRVELDGVLNVAVDTGPVGGIFVNVPAPFRPPLTSGGVMFGDTNGPLFFGFCNWIVSGDVQYGGNGDPGDVMLIGLHLPAEFEDAALSLNGIHWFTN